MEGNGPSLLGKDWLRHIRVDWKALFSLSTHSSLKELLEENREVFQDDLGELKGIQATLNTKSQATPRFHKARKVPYTLKEKVEEELFRLQAAGIIGPVKFSDWATSIVPVVKSNGTVRICGDYKTTVNPILEVDRHPLPDIDDLLSQLAGGVAFSKLDLSRAYHQLRLEEQSQELTTIITHKRLFRYHWLPFGIVSAPAIFQRMMEGLLKGMSGVVVYLDDILITGKSQTEHMENLREVLKRLRETGLRLQQDKCQFMKDSVVYLGHRIDKDGLHPTDEKVRAIRDAPIPRGISELKAYLGMLTYYSKFLPDQATVLAPLHALLQKGATWKWSEDEDKAFQESKRLLTSSRVLVHYVYNTKLPLLLACDASPFGLGAVLSHMLENGNEHPIAFASRSLSPAEKYYSQIDRKGAAIVFGISKIPPLYLWPTL